MSSERTPDEAAGTAAADDDAGGDAGQPASGRVRRRVLLAVGVVLVVLVLAAAWLAVRVYQAGRALSDAQAGLQTLSQDARSGDLAAVEAALPGPRDDLHRARAAVDDPVWRASLWVPWLGRQLGAVRTVTVALDDVAASAGPVLRAADQLAAASDAGHGLDLAPLVTAAPDLQVAAQRTAAGATAVAGIDTAGLLPQLADPVRRAQDELAGVGPAADAVSRIAGVLPAMLGADGPRTYLLASLNSAELRAQGGIAGAFAVLRVDGRSVTLVEQRTTASFAGLAQPVLPLTAAERQIYTDRLGQYVQDALATPDFPRAAQLLAARWDKDTGEHLDGVLATDVVAVSDLMRATGPVTTPSGERLTADDVVAALLQQAYVSLDRDQADQLFTEVAATMFGALTGGHVDPEALVREAADAAGQGRVRLWSAHDDEQTRILATRLGGGFLTGPYRDAAGVFLDDGTGGKLDYYLTTAVTVDDLRCTGPEPTATVTVDLRYDPPAGVAQLPWWVVGIDAAGLPAGDLATNVSVYAPVGARLGALALGGGGFVSGATGTIEGRAVQTVTARLTPGEHVSYSATVPVRDGRLSVWSTPTLTSSGERTVTCPSG